jgi:hypothetical protein
VDEDEVWKRMRCGGGVEARADLIRCGTCQERF